MNTSEYVFTAQASWQCNTSFPWPLLQWPTRASHFDYGATIFWVFLKKCTQTTFGTFYNFLAFFVFQHKPVDSSILPSHGHYFSGLLAHRISIMGQQDSGCGSRWKGSHHTCQQEKSKFYTGMQEYGGQPPFDLSYEYFNFTQNWANALQNILIEKNRENAWWSSNRSL